MSARKKQSRGQGPLRWILLGVAVLGIIAVVLVIILIAMLLRPGPGTEPTRPTPAPNQPATATAQPANCPDAQVIAIPGTWESSATDNPKNPYANPNSLILKVSRPIQQAFDPSRADVYTVPYVAQFHNPMNLTDRQQTYNASRAQGTRRTTDEMERVHRRCPLTGFIVLGFSQGAVIGGDIASQIGNGRGPIPADRVLAVGLIADGRRQPNEAKSVGPNPPGVGAEVALGGLSRLVPGITMTGTRDGGFGSLADRTYSLCAPGDLICDSPTITDPIGGLGKLFSALNNPVHAMYATPRYWSLDDGTTAVRWMTDWVKSVIEAAPHPPHK